MKQGDFFAEVLKTSDKALQAIIDAKARTAEDDNPFSHDNIIKSLEEFFTREGGNKSAEFHSTLMHADHYVHETYKDERQDPGIIYYAFLAGVVHGLKRDQIYYHCYLSAKEALDKYHIYAPNRLMIVDKNGNVTEK
jgi:hypothetical protein